MNIKISDSWLREFLETKASAAKIASCLSLCGPSVERLEKVDGDYVYNIEVTTNRVDVMSVYGIAREASAILPQFGIKATLKPMAFPSLKNIPQKGPKFDIQIDPKLTNRVMGVIISDIKNWQSPEWIVKRLEECGFRSLGSPVDITNYIMTEVGHPTHVFDYDLIKTHKFVIRASKKGEKIISLEGKEYTLPGGDIVIDDGTGKIIDLPGIIGTKNSVVNKDTKRVIFFTENNDPARIRHTSMTLGIRTVAAILNEKGVDPELAKTAILRGTHLFQKICGAKIISPIHDLYPGKQVAKSVLTNQEFIANKLGIQIPKEKIFTILKGLDFQARWSGNNLAVTPPSFRLNDILIPEDIVEEISRIYGYHNFPSQLMEGKLPEPNLDTKHDFETKIKNILKGLGGVEVYTLSLVSKEMAGEGALDLKNPLGEDSKYLRKTLLPSLTTAAKGNSGIEEPFHLFEMANVYLPRKKDLPEEKMTVSGIFSNFTYRKAKGVIEAFLEELKIKAEFIQKDLANFIPNHALQINCKGQKIGNFGVLEKDNYIYYEFGVADLQKFSKPFEKYKPLPRYPAQIEDITFSFPERVKIGEVVKAILQSNKFVADTKLITIYKDAYSLRIWYQNPTKTLTNKEVEKIRSRIIRIVEQRFGGTEN